MKTLKDFTPEIRLKIPQYINEAIDGIHNGKLYENFDLEKAKKAIYWNYQKCGLKKSCSTSSRKSARATINV